MIAEIWTAGYDTAIREHTADIKARETEKHYGLLNDTQ